MPTVLESKLYLPEPAGDHVARGRLYAQLDLAARHRLTLLCAPAGFGKTTLAATWLRRLLAAPGAGRAPLRAAWYTIDEQDDDLLTFVRYLVAAIQVADADLLRNWVELDQRPDTVIPEQLADQLAAELQNIEGQLVVALDDYHFVGNEQIHRLISQLLRHLPPTMHLVITSRYDPPIGLTLLRLRGEINEMRATGLAFTRDEATVFLHGAIGSDVDAAEADVVWRQTEGWAAGLRLAAISMSGTADRKRFVRDFARSTSRHVADYLMDQVLASQAPDVEYFLLRTSPLDRLCPALCAVVAEIPFSEAEAKLRYLESRGLFLLPLDDFGEWHRYHGQFRAMLYNRLRSHSAAAEVGALHQTAGAWFAGQGYLDDALQHYSAAGAGDLGADLLEEQIPSLLRAQQWRQSAHWLHMLPQDTIQRRPQLLLLSAWLAYMETNMPKVRVLVAQVEQLTGAEYQPGKTHKVPWDPVLGQVQALRISLAYREQSADEAIERGNQALVLLPPNYDAVRAHVFNFLGQWTLLRDGYEAAARLLQTELNEADTYPPEYALRLLYALIVVQFLTGHVDDMDLTARRHAQLALTLGIATQIQTSHLACGLIHFERGDSHAACRLLAAIFEQPHLAMFQTLRLASVPLLELYAAQGRDDKGQAVVDVLWERLKTNPSTDEREEIEAIAAYRSMLSGNFAPAEALIRGGIGMLHYAQAPYRDMIFVRMLQARGQPGDRQQALAIIQDSLAGYESPRGWRRGEIGMLVLAAQTHWLMGQQVQALQALRRALDLGYGRGWRRVFTTPGVLMGAMLHKLAREERYAAETGSLLAEIARAADFGQQQKRQASAEQHPPEDAELFIEPLSRREIEVLSLLADKLTNKEIARQLSISPLTVRNHTVQIYDKLHVESRRQAVARARQLGILAPA